jgi:hypothetical protein
MALRDEALDEKYSKLKYENDDVNFDHKLIVSHDDIAAEAGERFFSSNKNLESCKDGDQRKSSTILQDVFIKFKGNQHKHKNILAV